MRQSQQLLQALRASGSRGMHTFDMRAQLRVGNPSERRRELEALGHSILVIREKRGDRWGARFLLNHDAELGAVTDDPSVASAQPGGSELGVDPNLRLVCDATDRSNIRWREERIEHEQASLDGLAA